VRVVLADPAAFTPQYDPEHSGERLARPRAQRVDQLVVLLAAPPVDEIALRLLGHRPDRRARQRSVRARIQVRDPLQHGERRACLLERHSTRTSTGA